MKLSELPKIEQLMLRHIQMRSVRREQDRSVLFETLYAPFNGSSHAPTLAFGGLSVALAIQTAYHSLASTKGWCVQTIQGTFLGPMSVKAPVQIEVQDLRSTRRYQTRFVRIVQRSSKDAPTKQGQVRAAFLVDFVTANLPHVRHSVTGDELHYHRPCMDQSIIKTGPESSIPLLQVAQNALDRGVEASDVKDYCGMFDNALRMVDYRLPPQHRDIDGLMGIVPYTKEQVCRMPGGGKDGSKVTDYLWFKMHAMLHDVDRVNEEARSVVEGGALPIEKDTLGITSCALNLDPRLSGVFCSLHHLPIVKDFQDVTMDYSLRVHTPSIDDAEAWFVNETDIDAAGYSRFQGQSRAFDRRGTLVATCQQTCNVIDLRAVRALAATKKKNSAKM